VTRPTLSSLRARTLILVLLAALPALGLMLYTAREQQLVNAAQAQADAQRQAVLRAADQAEAVIAARQLLQTLSRLPSVRSEDVVACNDLLARLLPQYPAYSNLTVLRPNGDALCSAPTAAGLNFADRAYFQRATTSRDFAAGDYILGRITGRPTIDFALPVQDGSGRVTQVITLGMDLAWLNQSLASQTWPPGTTVTLIDQSGTIVGSYPDGSRIGQAVDRAEAQTIIGERQGTARSQDLTGRPTLLSFASTSAGANVAGIHVVIGMPEAVAFAQADRQRDRNVTVLALATLLICLVALGLGDYLVVRPVRDLLRTAQRFNQGDADARVGPDYRRGELGLLERSFDRLADALQSARGGASS
jgi:HAMP domain-containing protein/C4-dicarboxylate-specific signal transduction histidine kinase